MNHNIETCEHHCVSVPGSSDGQTRQVHCPDCGYSQTRGDAFPPDTAWTREYPQPPSSRGRILQRALAEVLMHRGLPLTEPQWGLPVTHAYSRYEAPKGADHNCWTVALTRRADDESDWSTTICLSSGNSEIAALEAALNLARHGSHPPLDGCIAAHHLGGPACSSTPGVDPAPAC